MVYSLGDNASESATNGNVHVVANLVDKSGRAAVRRWGGSAPAVRSRAVESFPSTRGACVCVLSS
jgi:hypothetical protein